MNKAVEVLYSRVSVKAYKPEQITKEELEIVLEAGKNAPTGMNRQSPVFIAVQDKTVRDELSALNASFMNREGDPFYGAPTVICVLVKDGILTNVEDGSLALGNMLNAAHAIGLGSCWIHRCKQMFESEYGKELLKKAGLEGYIGVGCCILGYPDGGIPAKKPRKSDYVVNIG